MLEKYFRCLYKQYCEARSIDINKEQCELSSNFVEWIINNKLLLGEYVDYLFFLGFAYDERDVVEVGKGRYDSLATANMSVASEFGSTQEKNDSSLFIKNGVSYIINAKGIIVPPQHIILTHNPYFSEEVLNWFLIHNAGEQNISIGMFGNITDSNAKQKVKILDQVAKKMSDDYSFEFDLDKDKYFCSLNSKRHVKRHVKNMI